MLHKLSYRTLDIIIATGAVLAMIGWTLFALLHYGYL